MAKTQSDPAEAVEADLYPLNSGHPQFTGSTWSPPTGGQAFGAPSRAADAPWMIRMTSHSGADRSIAYQPSGHTTRSSVRMMRSH